MPNSCHITSALLLFVLFASSCVDKAPVPFSESSDRVVASDPAPLHANQEQELQLRWVDSLKLEETSEAINVTPLVHPDPLGGYLIADFSEAQIRRYSGRGELLWHVGRRGKGPLEFQAPQVAVRLASDDVFVADAPRRLILLSSDGTSLVATFQTVIQRVEDGAVLNDSLLLLSGMPGSVAQMAVPETHAPSPRLHVFDVRRDTVVRSFFTPYEGFDPNLAVAIGSISFSVRGDLVAAGALAKDSVYLFDVSGRELRRFRLPTDHFRVVTPLSPEDFRNPRKRQRWLESFETLTALHWIDDGVLVAQFRGVRDNAPQWNTLAFTREGKRVYEWLDSPRLLTVLPETGALVFQDPNSLTPDSWKIARLER